MSHRTRHDLRFVVVAENWSGGLGPDEVFDLLKKHQIHYLRKEFYEATPTHKSSLALYYDTFEEAREVRKQLINLTKVERLRGFVKHVANVNLREDYQGTRLPYGQYDNSRGSDYLKQTTNKPRLPTLGEYRGKGSQLFSEPTFEQNNHIPQSEYLRERNAQREWSQSPEGRKHQRLNSPSSSKRMYRKRDRSRSRSRSKGYTVRGSRDRDQTSDSHRSMRRTSPEKPLESSPRLPNQERLNGKEGVPAADQSHPPRDEKYVVDENTLSVSNAVAGQVTTCELAHDAEFGFANPGAQFGLDYAAVSEVPAVDKIPSSETVPNSNPKFVDSAVVDATSRPLSTGIVADAIVDSLCKIESAQNSALQLVLAPIPPTANHSSEGPVSPQSEKTTPKSTSPFDVVQFRSDIRRAKHQINLFLRTHSSLIPPLRPFNGRKAELNEPETIDLTVPNPTIVPKKRKACV